MSMNKPIQTLSGTADLSSAALALTYTVLEENIEVLGAFMKASVAITETVTFTRVSVVGAAYSYLLNTDGLSAETIYAYTPGGNTIFAKRGDTLTLGCTKANSTGTVYAQILYRECV